MLDNPMGLAAQTTRCEGSKVPRRQRMQSLAVLGIVNRATDLAPGLTLTAGIALIATVIRAHSGLAILSPLILSLVMGTAIRNLIGTPEVVKPGGTFALKRILRAAVALLGFQLTIEQVRAVGTTGVAVIAATLVTTFFFTIWLGRLLRVDRNLTNLIAAGTSICGASAVIAANMVIEAEDEDVAYAVACTTVFGSVATLIYPLLPAVLQLDPHAYGLWSGASIHDIAQVIAAAFQDGRAAGEFGTIAKLTRVMMLAPVVVILGFVTHRKPNATSVSVPMPWFVLGFVALVVLNSFVALSANAKMYLATLTTFLLAISLSARGLETDVRKLRAKGLRPLVLGAGAFLFIASFSLALVTLSS